MSRAILRPFDFRLRLAFGFYYRSGVRPAIQCQIRSGDVTSLGSGNECDKYCNFLDASLATQRGSGNLHCCPISGDRVQFCVYRSRLNIVNCDAVVSHLAVRFSM